MRLVVGLLLFWMSVVATAARAEGHVLYDWPSDSRDTYYQGTAYFPDGTQARFRVRQNSALFPEGCRIVVVPYPKTIARQRAQFAGVARPKSQAVEPAITAEPVEPVNEPKPAESPIASESDEPAVAAEDGPVGDYEDDYDEVVGAETIPRLSETEQESRGGSSRGRGAATDDAGDATDQPICREITVGAGLYAGQEELETVSGVNKFSGDAPVGGTAVEASCHLSSIKTVAWRTSFRRHNFQVMVRETEGLEQRDVERSYERMELDLGVANAVAVGAGDLVVGLNLAYLTLPILIQNADANDPGVLRTKGGISGGVELGYVLRPSFGDLGFDFLYGPAAGLATGFRTALYYRGHFATTWQWQLDARYHRWNALAKEKCRDCLSYPETRTRATMLGASISKVF